MIYTYVFAFLLLSSQITNVLGYKEGLITDSLKVTFYWLAGNYSVPISFTLNGSLVYQESGVQNWRKFCRLGDRFLTPPSFTSPEPLCLLNWKCISVGRRANNILTFCPIPKLGSDGRCGRWRHPQGDRKTHFRRYFSTNVKGMNMWLQAIPSVRWEDILNWC
jgi:hypothetical protein